MCICNSEPSDKKLFIVHEKCLIVFDLFTYVCVVLNVLCFVLIVSCYIFASKKNDRRPCLVLSLVPDAHHCCHQCEKGQAVDHSSKACCRRSGGHCNHIQHHNQNMPEGPATIRTCQNMPYGMQHGLGSGPVRTRGTHKAARKPGTRSTRACASACSSHLPRAQPCAAPCELVRES